MKKKERRKDQLMSKGKGSDFEMLEGGGNTKSEEQKPRLRQGKFKIWDEKKKKKWQDEREKKNS